jgi:HK97 family phage portal protein
LWDAESSVANALYGNIYLYACARARAQDVSTLPIRVGADPDKPKDFDPQHPLAKLLGPAPGGPTMNISARRLIAWSLIQYDVTGRMVWEIAPPVPQRRDGVPFELWPIPSSYITPIYSTGGGEWFSGFEYTNKARQKRMLRPDQVLYHWRPHASDWRKPESLLEAARLNISIAVMQDRYDFAFLVNDARPAAVVVHEEFSAKRERDGFRRQFLEQHRGPDNAGKVAFVEASRDGALPKDSLLIQQLGLSQRDAEFINRMENQIRAICVAFNTPLSRLADSSRRTYSNAEVEAKHYWRTSVFPAGVEFCEALNIQLMPMLGDDSNVCWFDTTGVPELEPPRRFAVGDIPDLLDKGVITRNEARTSIELAELGPGGDTFVMTDTTSVDSPVRSAGFGSQDFEDPVAKVIPSLIQLWNNHLRSLQAAQNSAVLRRADGKRGRQATRNEDLTGLYDRTYWYNQAYDRYVDLFRSIYSVAVAINSASGREVLYGTESPEALAWYSRSAGTEAASMVEAIQSILRASTLENLETMLLSGLYEVNYSDVEHALRSALIITQSGSAVVSARAASEALVLLASGKMNLQEAMACLG